MADYKGKGTSNRRLLMPSEVWAGGQVCHLMQRYNGMPAALDSLENARRHWVLHQKFLMLDALARDLGIDLNSRSGHLLLALRLAEKHEPGFQDEAYEKPVRHRGRRVGTKIDYAQLLSDVHEKKEKAKLKSTRQACKDLARRGRWEEFSASALEKAASRAKAELSPLDTSHPLVSFLIEQAEAAERIAAERAAATEQVAAAQRAFEEELAKSPCDRKWALLLS